MCRRFLHIGIGSADGREVGGAVIPWPISLGEGGEETEVEDVETDEGETEAFHALPKPVPSAGHSGKQS